MNSHIDVCFDPALFPRCCTFLIESNTVDAGISTHVEEEPPGFRIIVLATTGPDPLMPSQLQDLRVGVFPPAPPAVPSPTVGELSLLPIRFPWQAGSAKSTAQPANGMKLPRSLDLWSNDVVFPAQITLFATSDSVVNGPARDHSIAKTQDFRRSAEFYSHPRGCLTSANVRKNSAP